MEVASTVTVPSSLMEYVFVSFLSSKYGLEEKVFQFKVVSKNKI
jgi:hypothetical protein